VTEADVITSVWGSICAPGFRRSKETGLLGVMAKSRVTLDTTPWSEHAVLERSLDPSMLLPVGAETELPNLEDRLT
jgi:hypothetical protein